MQPCSASLSLTTCLGQRAQTADHERGASQQFHCYICMGRCAAACIEVFTSSCGLLPAIVYCNEKLSLQCPVSEAFSAAAGLATLRRLITLRHQQAAPLLWLRAAGVSPSESVLLRRLCTCRWCLWLVGDDLRQPKWMGCMPAGNSCLTLSFLADCHA